MTTMTKMFPVSACFLIGCVVSVPPDEGSTWTYEDEPQICVATDGTNGGDAGTIDLRFGPGWPEHSTIQVSAGAGGVGGVGASGAGAPGDPGAPGAVLMTEDPDATCDLDDLDPDWAFEVDVDGDQTHFTWYTRSGDLSLIEADRFVIGTGVDLVFHGDLTVRAREFVIEPGASLTVRAGDGIGLSAPGLAIGDVPEWWDADGGSLVVDAERVVLEGDIDVSGLDAIDLPTMSDGGSGGSILMTTKEFVWIDGAMRANGGQGEDGVDERECERD